MTQFSLGGAAAPRRLSIPRRPTLDARMLEAPIARRGIALAAFDAEMTANREAEAIVRCPGKARSSIKRIRTGPHGTVSLSAARLKAQ